MDGYWQALETFSHIPNHGGVPQLIEECKQKADKLLLETSRSKKAKQKRLSIIIVSCCALIALGVLLLTIVLPHIRDNNTVSMTEESKYGETISTFNETDEYVSSSPENELSEQDIQYDEAIALMEAGKYKEAIEAFRALVGYKDSGDKISACSTAMPLP